jgi:hypothetical protein
VRDSQVEVRIKRARIQAARALGFLDRFFKTSTPDESGNPEGLTLGGPALDLARAPKLPVTILPVPW